MHIRIMNRNCFKTELSEEECRAFGIDYDSFSGDDLNVRLFIASVLRRLEDMGMETSGNDKLTAEVFERSDGGLIIYISGKCLELITNAGEGAVRCCSPGEVISALFMLSEPEAAELYKLDGDYILIYPEPDRNKQFPEHICAKIREYGDLLSNAPFQKLYDIKDFSDR